MWWSHSGPGLTHLTNGKGTGFYLAGSELRQPAELRLRKVSFTVAQQASVATTHQGEQSVASNILGSPGSGFRLLRRRGLEEAWCTWAP